jgi:hypothetical protein
LGLSWIAVSSVTGEQIADLPDLQVDGIKQIIGRYDSGTATLPIPTAPENWERATLPKATNLILLDDDTDDPRGTPIWGCAITNRKRTDGDEVFLSWGTAENYFRDRFIGNRTFTGVGQNDIFAALINEFVKLGPNGGIPMRLEYAGAGKLRDKTYTDREDKTVYSAMQDWSGIIGGPEWTIGWEWQAATVPPRVTPVLYVSGRLGKPVTPGLDASAYFNMPGDIQSFEHTDDYSNGKGATTVLAVSSGQGDDRPQSTLTTITDPLRPTVEFRYTPSTSIKLTSTLDEYAQNAAAAMAGGSSSVALTSNYDAAPKLGRDWVIGDDIGYDITSSAFPAGLKGVARAIGFEISMTEPKTITPILVGADI